jgi:plasmid stabilization system protein ParE
MVPVYQLPELREIIFRSYRIIYRMNNTDRSLEIVRFWHGARGFPQIPRGGHIKD